MLTPAQHFVYREKELTCFAWFRAPGCPRGLVVDNALPPLGPWSALSTTAKHPVGNPCLLRWLMAVRDVFLTT